MTNEEAIEILKNMLPEKIDYADLVGAVNHASGEYVYADPEPYAIDLAIQALEKQIAKKIVIKKEYDADLDVTFKLCLCPTCGNQIYKYIQDSPILSSTYPCCWKCGQALDWSD